MSVPRTRRPTVSLTIASIFVRVLVILLSLAGAAGHVAYLDALWWHKLDLTTSMAGSVSGAVLLTLSAHAVVSVVCSVLAVVIVLHERRRPEAALALGTAFATWSYLMAYSGVTMLFRPAGAGPARELFEAHFLVVEVLGLASLLRFTSIFPRSLAPDELRAIDTLPRILRPFHDASVVMRRPAAPFLAGAFVLVAAWSWAVLRGGGLSNAGLSRFMDLARFCTAGLVVMNLRRAWTAATEGDRDALIWLAVALSVLFGSLALLIGGNVLVAVTGFPEPDVAWRPILLDVGLIGFLVALAMSVLSHGERDPAMVARRIARSAVVATAGLFLAAGLEALFSGEILAAVALRSGVGTAVAFAVILSTHRGLARLVDRVMPAW